jgi:hypothetical protein
MARRADKHKLVEKAIKREQVKQAKHAKKREKVARAKKVAESDSNRQKSCTTWKPGSLVKRKSLLKMLA